MNEICSEEDTQEWGLSMFEDQVRLWFYPNVIVIVCKISFVFGVILYRKLQRVHCFLISIIATC